MSQNRIPKAGPLLLALAALAGCGLDAVGPRLAATVQLTPAEDTVLIGESTRLELAAVDLSGEALAGRPVTWRSSANAVATVDDEGVVTGVETGSTTIVATVDERRGIARIVVTALKFEEFALGGLQTCAIRSDGTVYCWGLNEFGQLGTEGGRMNCGAEPNLVSCHDFPRPVQPALVGTRVAVGRDHSCALDEDGAAYCWGRNHAGQLGTGAASDSSVVPLEVAGGIRFERLAAGASFSCGIATSETAWCWGNNTFGQLGTGSAGSSPEPVRVASTSPFAAIVAGQRHACALDDTGNAWCWGGNTDGQLGNGTTANAFAPVRVEDARAYRSISVGERHSCAVSLDGEAFCWGSSGNGQLGAPGITASTRPVRVAAEVSFVSIAAGDFHTCALDSSQRVHCWGFNRYGQLGVATGSGGPQPRPVAGSASYARIGAGRDHTCALTTGGSLHCWGYNGAGQLGSAASEPCPSAPAHTRCALLPTPVYGSSRRN